MCFNMISRSKTETCEVILAYHFICNKVIGIQELTPEFLHEIKDFTFHLFEKNSSAPRDFVLLIQRILAKRESSRNCFTLGRSLTHRSQKGHCRRADSFLGMIVLLRSILSPFVDCLLIAETMSPLIFRACLFCWKWEEKVEVGNGEEKVRKM